MVQVGTFKIDIYLEKTRKDGYFSFAGFFHLQALNNAYYVKCPLSNYFSPSTNINLRNMSVIWDGTKEEVILSKVYHTCKSLPNNSWIIGMKTVSLYVIFQKFESDFFSV